MAASKRAYHHGDLRNALLQEAAKLVESEGVNALTLRELARRLGVSHAAPTSHFADRDALLAEVAAEGFDGLRVALQAVPPARTPVLHLRDLGRAYVAFARAHPGQYRVMFGRGFSTDMPQGRLTEVGRQAYGVFEQAVLAALPPTRRRVPERVLEAAFLAWSVVHGAAMLALDGPLGPLLEQVNPGADMISILVERATTVVSTAISEGL